MGIGEEDAAAADAEGAVRPVCVRPRTGRGLGRAEESSNAKLQTPNSELRAELFFLVLRGQEDPSTSLRAGPGQAGFVGDVPAEGLEEGVEELSAELFFFVVWGQEDLAVAGEPLDEVSHQCGRRSSHGGSRIFSGRTKSSLRRNVTRSWSKRRARNGASSLLKSLPESSPGNSARSLPKPLPMSGAESPAEASAESTARSSPRSLPMS